MKKRLTILCTTFLTATFTISTTGAEQARQAGSALLVPAQYPTIQECISAAVDGDTCLVAPGTYVENIDFLGKAITLRSDAGADVTIIDGNQTGSVVTFSSGMAEEALIEGFTIRNGDAYTGGGIHCDILSPTITNCTITGNIASYGGGIHCFSSESMITNCRIIGNFASNLGGSGGGGIYCVDSSPTISCCTIKGNIASYDGGGINCRSYSPKIDNCEITENTARYGGGISSFSSYLTILNCTISRNRAEQGGGINCSGPWSQAIVNCTITENIAYSGGGIFCSHGLPVIVNSTISANIAYGGGGICCGSLSFLMVINSIFWADSATLGPEIYIAYLSGLIVRYSDVQGGEADVFVENYGFLFWRDWNIDSDPLFVGGGDYHLTSGSPCIDAGKDARVYMDIDGDVRPMGAGFDMGSDEYPVGGQDFTLEMDATYAAGTLGLDFTLGTPEEAMWATNGILLYPTLQIIPLWEKSVPRTIPQVGFSVSFPYPSTGVIGIFPGLYTAGAPKTTDLTWVDTGWPSE